MFLFCKWKVWYILYPRCPTLCTQIDRVVPPSTTSDPPTPQPASPSPPPLSAVAPTLPSHPPAATSSPHPTVRRNSPLCRQTAISTRGTATGSSDATPSSTSPPTPLPSRTCSFPPRASPRRCTRPGWRTWASGRRGAPWRRVAGGRRRGWSSIRPRRPSRRVGRAGGRCRRPRAI